MSHKAGFVPLLAQLPGGSTSAYPEGVPFVQALAHGSMSVELFAPGSNTDGIDRQQPHAQDELYIVQKGQATLNLDGQRLSASTGDVLFVPAGALHHFEAFSPDFATWVVFYGPAGGEHA